MKAFHMSPEVARQVIEAVVQDGEPKFATALPSSGDVALVLKAGGGVEILSVLQDNPDETDIADLGVRGTVALALFSLLSNHTLMTQVLSAAVESVTLPDQPAPTAH